MNVTNFVTAVRMHDYKRIMYQGVVGVGLQFRWDHKKALANLFASAFFF